LCDKLVFSVGSNILTITNKKERMMKKAVFMLVVALVLGLTFYGIEGEAHGPGMMGPGMMGGGWHCPYCGQPMGPGIMGGGMMGRGMMGRGMMGGGMMGRGNYGPQYRPQFSSAGEQIYYTGISGSGYPTPLYGGPMWLRMHGGGCVSCHGIQGRGGVPVMMGTAIPTDIRYGALTGEEEHVHEGKAEEHKYTDPLIKRAITQGLHADGKGLDWTMPRWQMSDPDLNELIEYLKTLE
jgi:mono/diheme cytochrome c family protein